MADKEKTVKGDYIAKEDLMLTRDGKVISANTPGVAGTLFALKGQTVAEEIATDYKLYDLDKPAEAPAPKTPAGGTSTGTGTSTGGATK